jgi:FeS assembly SUF system protein
MSTNPDVFGRKHLSVMNHVGPAATPSHFQLEDPGLSPSDVPVAASELTPAVIAILKTVYDPEIPLNIYDLGLVYRVAVDDVGRVEVAMTLTSPGCPVADVLIRQVHDAVQKVPGVVSVKTELVWDPPWTKASMTDAAKLALGLL